MTRSSTILGVASAIALGTAASAFAADPQLIASAGLTPEQAQDMSLTEIAQYKFNRDESGADRWLPTIPATNGSADNGQLAASAGLSPADAAAMSRTEVAAVKFNNDTRPDDYQTVARSRYATIATRSGGEPTKAFAQLIASAGLTPSKASGMSLNQIAAYKFDRDTQN